MFHSRKFKIKLIDRMLRVTYHDRNSSVHLRTAEKRQEFAKQKFEIFSKWNIQSLYWYCISDCKANFHFENLYSVYCIQEMEGTLCLTWCSINFAGAKIWDLAPGKIKQSEPVSVFKAKFRKCDLERRSWTFCKVNFG